MKTTLITAMVLTLGLVANVAFAEVEKDATLEKNFNLHTTDTEISQDSFNLLIIESAPGQLPMTIKGISSVNKTKHNCVANRTQTRCF